MSTTKVPSFLITPNPPSSEEIATALDTKLNITDYNTTLTSVNNRLDTIDNTFNNYLPLSGGTITGPVYLQNNTTSKNDGYMLTDDSLNAHYGFNWGKGPGIIFRGFNFGNPTAEAGNFAIYARSSTSTNNYILVGRPDGHLMWGTALNSGKEVERVDSTSVTADNGYIKYASGMIFQWGITSVSTGSTVTNGQYESNTVTCTYPIAFANANYGVSLQVGDVGGVGKLEKTVLVNQTATGFTYNVTAIAASTSIQVRWIAYGFYK